MELKRKDEELAQLLRNRSPSSTTVRGVLAWMRRVLGMHHFPQTALLPTALIASHPSTAGRVSRCRQLA